MILDVLFFVTYTSRLKYIASIVHLLVLIFIIVAGLTKADAANYTPFTPFKVHGIFKASVVLFFTYVEFDAGSTLAEETKNPVRDIPIGLVGSMVVTTIVYCLTVITLCLMQPYYQIDTHAPFSIAFEAVRMDWAEYIVAFGALEGMTMALLTVAVGLARYITHIARMHMMPPWFAKVNKKTRTPVIATIVMVSATAVIAFFRKLEILSKLLSISTLFIFMLVAVALLVRQYYISGVTKPTDHNKLIVCILLIVGSSIATATYWGLSEQGWVGYVITMPIWFLATVALRVLVLHARNPKLWGVPLDPWLPLALIAINIFLLGSIDQASFEQFGMWTGFLLLYYYFGLHASYDTARESGETKGKDGLEWKKIEEGNVSSTPNAGPEGVNIGSEASAIPST